jgi:outer membrane lipoprotein SlyB
MANNDDKNENVVIAFYADEAAAQSAIDGLKDWDRINDSMRLGEIAMVTKTGGKVKTHVGRKTGKGAAIGAVVGVIGAVLTGGASLVVTTVGGSILGGALGAFFKRSLNLTEDEISRIGVELDAGKAAVVVTCDDFEIPMATEFLAAAHGTVHTYRVPAAALAETAATMEEPAVAEAMETAGVEATEDSK